jgi:hypothetical protein
MRYNVVNGNDRKVLAEVISELKPALARLSS